MTTIKKRIDLIKEKNDIRDTIKLSFKIRKEKTQLKFWIIDEEQYISELEEKINKIKSNGDGFFCVDNLLDTIYTLQIHQRRLRKGKEILKELF